MRPVVKPVFTHKDKHELDCWPTWALKLPYVYEHYSQCCRGSCVCVCVRTWLKLVQWKMIKCRQHACSVPFFLYACCADIKHMRKRSDLCFILTSQSVSVIKHYMMESCMTFLAEQVKPKLFLILEVHFNCH